MCGSLSGPIDVGAMIDAQDANLSFPVVDLIHNSVRASTSCPHAFKLAAELVAHSIRCLDEGPEHEFDDRCGGLLG